MHSGEKSNKCNHCDNNHSAKKRTWSSLSSRVKHLTPINGSTFHLLPYHASPNSSLSPQTIRDALSQAGLAHCCAIFLGHLGIEDRNIDDQHRNPKINIRQTRQGQPVGFFTLSRIRSLSRIRPLSRSQHTIVETKSHLTQLNHATQGNSHMKLMQPTQLGNHFDGHLTHKMHLTC